MLKQKAGEVAGKIWNYLHANENQDLEALKKAIGEKDEYLYMAIGWLLRENKIVGDNGKLNLR